MNTTRLLRQLRRHHRESLRRSEASKVYEIRVRLEGKAKAYERAIKLVEREIRWDKYTPPARIA